jgi:serine/threonine-protein kinase
MLGTPAFMAPEQARGQTKEVEGRTDLWAVGATMFSLISGKLVHEADSATQLLLRAATTPARSLGTVDPEVPAAIVKLVDKALAFEKSARWADAATMRDALKDACQEALGEPPSRDKLAEFLAALDTRAVSSTSKPPAPPPQPDDPPPRDSTVATKAEGKGPPKLAQTLVLATKGTPATLRDGAAVDAAAKPATEAKPADEAPEGTPPAGTPGAAAKSTPSEKAAPAAEPDDGPPTFQVRTLPLAQKSPIPRGARDEVGLTTSKPVSKETPASQEAEAPAASSKKRPARTQSYVPLAVGIVVVVGILVGIVVLTMGGPDKGRAIAPPPAASTLPAPSSAASALPSAGPPRP